MKVKYISVLRKLGLRREGGYLVRCELEDPPAAFWSGHFQSIWTATPSYRKICPEPRLNRNEILIPVKDSEGISCALTALQAIIPNLGKSIFEL